MQHCMIASIHGIRYIQGIREGVVNSIREVRGCCSNEVVTDLVIKDEQELFTVEERTLKKKN